MTIPQCGTIMSIYIYIHILHMYIYIYMFIIYVYVYIYIYIHTYISRYSSFWRTCAANNPVLPHVRHIRPDPRASSPKLWVKWDLQISPFIQLHPASNYMVTYMALKKLPRQNFRNQKIIGNDLRIVVTQWGDPFTSTNRVSPVEDSHGWVPQTYAMPPPTPRPRSARISAWIFPLLGRFSVQKRSLKCWSSPKKVALTEAKCWFSHQGDMSW